MPHVAARFFWGKCIVKRLFSAAVLAAASAAMLPAHADDLARKLADQPSFRTFGDALKASGLLERLHGSGPYTVFAPSEEAFKAAAGTDWDALRADKKRLADALSHFIVPGKLVVSEVKPGEVATLRGDAVRLTSDNGIVSVDGAKVTQSDILADNGVIHEIDRLVLPGTASSGR